MPNKVLQCNLNHARQAQDLLLQVMAKRDASIAIVTEPYRVPPDHPHWASDRLGLMAITWRQTESPLPCSPLEIGEGFLVVKWGEMVVIGTYISPSFDIAQFEDRLADIECCYNRFYTKPTVIAGDFNAKSNHWGHAAQTSWADTLRTGRPRWACAVLILVETAPAYDRRVNRLSM